MNLNDGFFHWSSGYPTNNLARQLSWPLFLDSADQATLDSNLNWTWTKNVVFGLDLREGHPNGDYTISYSGPAGLVKFAGDGASADGLTWTKDTPISLPFIQIRGQIDMRTLVVKHSSWPDTGWNATFLNHVGHYGIHRYMDWQATNKDSSRTPHQTSSGDHFAWEERPLPSQWSFFTSSASGNSDAKQVPLEVMIDLANTLNIDPWFCFHTHASDAYIQSFCELVDNTLNAGLVARFERSSEVWNYQFPQASYTESLYSSVPEMPAANGNQYFEAKAAHHYLTQQIGAIVKSVNSDPNRFKMVLGIQHSGNIDKEPIGFYGTTGIDEFSSACYIGSYRDFNYTDPNGNNYQPAADPALILSGGADYYFNTFLPYSMDLTMDRAQQKVDDIADTYGLDYIGYEGGMHFVAHDNNPAMIDLIVQVNRDPRMYGVYREMLERWDDITSNAPLVLFNSTRSLQDKSGNAQVVFSHQEYEGQSIAEAHKLRAIYDHYVT